MSKKEALVLTKLTKIPGTLMALEKQKTRKKLQLVSVKEVSYEELDFVNNYHDREMLPWEELQTELFKRLGFLTHTLDDIKKDWPQKTKTWLARLECICVKSMFKVEQIETKNLTPENEAFAKKKELLYYHALLDKLATNVGKTIEKNICARFTELKQQEKRWKYINAPLTFLSFHALQFICLFVSVFIYSLFPPSQQALANGTLWFFTLALAGGLFTLIKVWRPFFPDAYSALCLTAQVIFILFFVY